MAEASRRAARPAPKGGLVNALFILAAAEALPYELDGLVNAVTVHFPWGSLLRGLLGPEGSLLAGLSRILKPDGDLSLLVSLTERDQSAGLAPLDLDAVQVLGACYRRFGFEMTAWRKAAQDEIDAAHSSWAKRMGAGHKRPAWLISFRRCEPAPRLEDRADDALPQPR
jgi:16S rRNA (adenine(1408)-N(1))-methyltransferase